MVKAQRVAASLSLECVELTELLVSPKESSFAFLTEILPMSVCADMSFEGCCMNCEQSSFFDSTWYLCDGHGHSHTHGHVSTTC